MSQSKMDSLYEEIKRIVAIIISAQDPELREPLSIDELKNKKENLNQLISDISERALALKESNPDQRERIDTELKRVKALSNGAINYLDTKIKEKEELMAPATSRASESVADPSTSTAAVELNLPTGQTNQTSGPEGIALNSIISQIRNQFTQMLNDPRFFGRQPVNQPGTEPVDTVDPAEINSSSSFMNEVVGSANQNAVHDEFVEANEAQAPKRARIVEKPTLQLKFDRIKMQPFSGKLTEWIAFRDQYNDLVHTNSNLTEITKFYQLQTHLIGDALEVVNGFKMSSVDYEPAWQALLQRYDNKLNLIFEYIKQFFTLPILPAHADKFKFLAMIDKTKQMLRVLPRFNIDTESWDPIVMYILQTKLNNYSLKKWQNQLKRREDVPLSEMIEFLEVEAATAPSTSSQSELNSSIVKRKIPKFQNRPPFRNPVVLTQTTELSKCHLCKADHPIYRCATFLALDVPTRVSKVRLFKLCMKCLNKHGKNECKFSNCRTCQGAHNHLLCTKRAQEKAAAETQTRPATA